MQDLQQDLIATAVVVVVVVVWDGDEEKWKGFFGIGSPGLAWRGVLLCVIIYRFTAPNKLAAFSFFSILIQWEEKERETSLHNFGKQASEGMLIFVKYANFWVPPKNRYITRVESSWNDSYSASCFCCCLEESSSAWPIIDSMTHFPRYLPIYWSSRTRASNQKFNWLHQNRIRTVCWLRDQLFQLRSPFEFQREKKILF